MTAGEQGRPMRIVIDAFGVSAGSTAVTLENLLKGWAELDIGDRITVLSEGEPAFALPEGVDVETVSPPVPGPAGGLWLRSFGVRSAAKRLGADGVVSGVTASGFAGAPCPRGAILYDLRHELRPHQFSRAKRLARKLSYGWTFRTADGVYCISNRTRDDLVRSRPWMKGKAVLARYGADHADAWKVPTSGEGSYALAFGHFENKNVNAVLDSWALFCRGDSVDGAGRRGAVEATQDGAVTDSTTRAGLRPTLARSSRAGGEMTLRLVGMGKADRAAATERVDKLGIADRVELMPWLDDEEFVECFAGAGLVLFPSDFEGFGLPAVEALRLEIPLVISDDVALAEVTGGHAAVASDVRPETVVTAIEQALALTSRQRRAGREHTEQFKWRHMAQAIRDALIAASSV